MCLATYPRGDAPETGADDPRRGGLAHLTDGARHRSTLLGRLISSLLPSDEGSTPGPLARHAERCRVGRIAAARRGAGVSPSSAAALSCPIRFADARGRMKGAMIRGVARDADLLALVPVSLF
jgi:hypothetical protein